MNKLLLSGAIIGLSELEDWWNAPPKPEYKPIRDNFAEACLQVVDRIERGHNHLLQVGKDIPANQKSIDWLNENAHDEVERAVVEDVSGLLYLGDRHDMDSDFYTCDTQLRSALESRKLRWNGSMDCGPMWINK